MNRNITRIVAKIAGPVVGIGMLAGAAGALAPQAAAAPTSQTKTCTTSTGVSQSRAGAPSIMTRAGQLAGSASAPSAPSSCVNH